MKIAVEGCAHGELEKIYETIQCLEKKENIKVDLLLCCGDFQSTRNMEDLQTMAVPPKYLDICTFYKYYSGELLAPILTIFVGGNHEASNYLQELPYGGWVAPNIYYLGYAGVVNVNGVRIAGVSGIQKDQDFLRGRFEYSPYNDSSKRSVYHVRQLEIFRLKQLTGKIDIFMSHDWPNGIVNYGNKAQLLRFKPHFREDIEHDKLGSKPCMELLMELKPAYWFAAHLHCKFAALVPHDTKIAGKTQLTKFLALDKCLPKRRFLQICDIPSEAAEEEEEIKFEYDLEWLTILHLTNHLLSIKKCNQYMPGPGGTDERYNFTPTEAEKEQVFNKLNRNLSIPKNFCRTVEAFNPSEMQNSWSARQPRAVINPQCTEFCELLGLDDPVSLALVINGQELNHSRNLDVQDESVCESETTFVDSTLGMNEVSFATDEIQLSDLEEEEEKKEEKDEKESNKVEETKIEQETGEQPIKKFRRRNESIYKSTLEDENEQN